MGSVSGSAEMNMRCFLHVIHKDIKQLNDDFFTVVEQMVKEDPRMTGISLGYAYVNTSGENIAGVVNLADQELYRSKQKRPHVNRHQV